jgi:hypothetical protein
MLHRAEGPAIKLGLRNSPRQIQKRRRRKHSQRSLRIFFSAPLREPNPTQSLEMLDFTAQ